MWLGAKRGVSWWWWRFDGRYGVGVWFGTKRGGLDVVGVGIGSWAADFGWFEGFDGVRGVESG
jgi:hypothetical protein